MRNLMIERASNPIWNACHVSCSPCRPNHLICSGYFSLAHPLRNELSRTNQETETIYLSLYRIFPKNAIKILSILHNYFFLFLFFQ